MSGGGHAPSLLPCSTDEQGHQGIPWHSRYGPTMKAFEAVGEVGRSALQADLFDLIAGFNRAADGTMVVPSEYLEAVIVTR